MGKDEAHHQGDQLNTHCSRGWDSDLFILPSPHTEGSRPWRGETGVGRAATVTFFVFSAQQQATSSPSQPAHLSEGPMNWLTLLHQFSSSSQTRFFGGAGSSPGGPPNGLHSNLALRYPRHSLLCVSRRRTLASCSTGPVASFLLCFPSRGSTSSPHHQQPTTFKTAPAGGWTQNLRSFDSRYKNHPLLRRTSTR
jgi:hypothetical protein